MSTKMATKQSSNRLRYPLTQQALKAAFQGLDPEAVSVTHGGAEATIDGAWQLPVLRRRFAELGFEAVGHRDSLLFVNQQRNIGLQCQGVEPDPKKNTWKSYCVEVQCRSLEEARRMASVERLPTSAPGGFSSQANLVGL